MADETTQNAASTTDEGSTISLVEKALTSNRAAESTGEMRDKIAAAMAAPEGEREPLLIEALAAATEALDALTARLEAEARA